MIRLEDVCVFYGDKQVLKNVNLHLQEGMLNVIIGKNGSGKSTLLKAITNQLKYTGKVMIDNQNLQAIYRKQRSQTISYLPQITTSANITVNKLVQHGRYPYTTYNRVLSEVDDEIILKSMENADVLHLRHRYINQLSGGERQRAFLAMILAQDTNIIVLDEPCNFLDIDHQLSILKIISNLKSNGKTIVLVLHDIQQAFTIADKIIVLDEGEIVLNDTTEKVATSGKIETVFNLKIKKCNQGIYNYFLEER